MESLGTVFKLVLFATVMVGSLVFLALAWTAGRLLLNFTDAKQKRVSRAGELLVALRGECARLRKFSLTADAAENNLCEADRGLKSPCCGARSKVVTTQAAGSVKLRKRQCLACGRAFTTTERAAPIRASSRRPSANGHRGFLQAAPGADGPQGAGNASC